MKTCKLFFLLVFLLHSCLYNTQNPNDISIPESNVSFQKHILPVLKNNCGLSYCHGEVAPQGNVQIYDYYSLMNSYNGALVIPGNPDGSVLIQIFEYKLPHNPFLQWKLTENQRLGLRKWILEGAKNN